MRLYLAAGTAALVLALNADCVSAQSLSVTTPSGRRVNVTTITPDILRVENYPLGSSPSATLDNAPAATDVGAKTIDAGNVKMLTTPTGLRATLVETTGGVTIDGGQGRRITDTGVRTLAPGRQQLSIFTPRDGSGSFYGAGERGYSFNLAGDTLVMYNKQNYGYRAGEERIKQMNITMPLFLSPDGYAIVFDDYAAASMVMSDPIVYTTESSVPVSYYFVNSTGSLSSLVPELSRLTGRQELPPLWSLGYITSKYGYHTQDETLGVVDTLKQAGYPLDGVVLDLYWYGKEEDMGRLAWDLEQWPDHRKMLADLKDKGVNTVIISQPYVLRNGRGADNYNTLAEAGMLLADSTGAPQEVTIWVGDGGMFDVSNPATKAWLADRYRQLTLEGVGGWWGDLGEPEVHPESGIHSNGLSTRLYHNRYGNDWSKIIHSLYKTSFPDTRLMTMMRGGTTGLQQYSVFPWSTDVSRSWDGLRPQITIMLNSGLSGLGYMSHDVGGFAIDETAPYDPELYVRWLQLGTFSPVLRTHAQATAEPYNYPAQQSIILPLIKERYRWLPYNYTLAYENATQGLPPVRPLNFYTPGSSRHDDITDEYLWGRDLLVAPVLEQGATTRQVVFPDGDDVWLQLGNPDISYSAGDTITADAPLEVLPLYVRGGAFIPTAEYDMDNTGDYLTSDYTINYYPASGRSSYTLFEDDLKSTSLLSDGHYRLITFTGDDTDKTISIQVDMKGQIPGEQPLKTLRFKVYRMSHSPRSVTVISDGTGSASLSDRSYDQSTHTFSFTLTLPAAESAGVNVVIDK